jgi:hypothetical protein
MSLFAMEISNFDMETPPPQRHGHVSPGGSGGSPGVQEFLVSWHDQPVPEVTEGIQEVPETPPPHQGGYGSPPGSRGVIPLADHDVARMERLAAGEARASKVKEKRAPEAMVKKLAAMSDAAEKRKNDRKRDILKTGQRQQLSNHKAGKVFKRPAGSKKTPEGEEEFQGSGDDFQASEVPSTQSSSSSCLPTAAGLSQITGKGKGRGRGKGKGKVKQKSASLIAASSSSDLQARQE